VMASKVVTKVWAVVAIVLSGALLAGCGRRATPESTDTLNVTVSILPQKYFVERVGGAQVRVSVMVEPGANPATYEPKPGQLAALSEADVYFSIGVPFERAWLDRIGSVNREMLMVDTSEGIARMAMAAHPHHGEGGHEGEPENADPHIWLSPALVRVQAQTIYEALATLDPDRQAEYEANLDRFIADIDALEEIHRVSPGVGVFRPRLRAGDDSRRDRRAGAQRGRVGGAGRESPGGRHQGGLCSTRVQHAGRGNHRRRDRRGGAAHQPAGRGLAGQLVPGGRYVRGGIGPMTEGQMGGVEKWMRRKR